VQPDPVVQGADDEAAAAGGLEQHVADAGLGGEPRTDVLGADRTHGLRGGQRREQQQGEQGGHRVLRIRVVQTAPTAR
jgi:hypothetical protein